MGLRARPCATGWRDSIQCTGSPRWLQPIAAQGAISEDETLATGLSVAQLRLRSFAAIVAGRGVGGVRTSDSNELASLGRDVRFAPARAVESETLDLDAVKAPALRV